MTHPYTLILLRGLPGSGKSTFAEMLSEQNKYPVFSVDDYFTDKNSGVYTFDYSKNHLAYAACQQNTETAMLAKSEKIILDNTFVFDWEMKPYHSLAKKYGYRVFSVVVENRHGGKNLHEIPEEAIHKMATKLEVKLY